MRIICPTCASHYEVDSDRIAAQGQLVRCAHCRDVWLVRPTEQASSRPAFTAAPAVASPGPRPETGAPSRPQVVDFQAARLRLRAKGAPSQAGRDWASSFSVFAIGALVLSAAVCLSSFRAAVVERLPFAAGLYAAAGLPVTPDRLALRDVRSVVVGEGNDSVLTLQGRIANTGDTPAAVPNLTVVVRGKAQAPLYSWTAAAPKPLLASGESIDFHTRLAAPPAAGQDIRVSFADAAPATPPRR